MKHHHNIVEAKNLFENRRQQAWFDRTSEIFANSPVSEPMLFRTSVLERFIQRFGLIETLTFSDSESERPCKYSSLLDVFSWNCYRYTISGGELILVLDDEHFYRIRMTGHPLQKEMIRKLGEECEQNIALAQRQEAADLALMRALEAVIRH